MVKIIIFTSCSFSFASIRTFRFFGFSFPRVMRTTACWWKWMACFLVHSESINRWERFAALVAWEVFGYLFGCLWLFWCLVKVWRYLKVCLHRSHSKVMDWLAWWVIWWRFRLSFLVNTFPQSLHGNLSWEIGNKKIVFRFISYETIFFLCRIYLRFDLLWLCSCTAASLHQLDFFFLKILKKEMTSIQN